VLVVNLIVLAAVVWPQAGRVSAAEQQAAAAERQRVAAEAELKRTEALRDGQRQATEDLRTFYEKVLPANVAEARRLLQLKLRQQAQVHGVEYQGGGTTEEEIRDSELLRLTTRMRLSGEYRDIRALIYELETSEDFLVLENLQLAEGIDQNAPLSLSLDVSTYYLAARRATAAEGDGR